MADAEGGSEAGWVLKAERWGAFLRVAAAICSVIREGLWPACPSPEVA